MSSGKVYRGIIPEPLEWNVVVIDSKGHEFPLPPRLDVYNHSPTGLSWGYAGSGPSQLALAILCDAVGVRRALPLYQQFKFKFIAPLDIDEPWEMKASDVVRWVKAEEANKELEAYERKTF